MSLDVLYLAWNRREFTEVTFSALFANTNWSLVNRLVVCDDGSTDGTQEELRARLSAWPGCCEFRTGKRGSPVAVMADYLAGDPADWFVKVDNDVAVPPGWLDALLSVRDGYPECGVDLLGFEAGMTEVPGRDGALWDGTYGFRPASHIGGVGLMRTAAFDGRPLHARGRRFGFTEWQHVHEPVRGWIVPDLPSPLLDRVPVEPYASLSAEYVTRGWQRRWPAYDPVWMRWAYEWLPDVAEVAA